MKKEQVNPSANQAFVMKEQLRQNRESGKNPTMPAEMKSTGAYCTNSGEAAMSFGKKLTAGLGPDYPVKG